MSNTKLLVFSTICLIASVISCKKDQRDRYEVKPEPKPPLVSVAPCTQTKEEVLQELGWQGYYQEFVLNPENPVLIKRLTFDDKAKLSTKLNCFKDLTQLRFEGTNIDNLAGLEDLDKLELISLHTVKYSKFPSTFKTVHVSGVGVYYTIMSSLPVEFCGMTGLKSLVFRDNQMKSLPDCLGNLQSLEMIDFGFNQQLSLIGLNVKTLQKMKGLKRIYVRSNISDADKQTLQKALPHVQIN
jgi:Leucine-rich repeat (LRR) protein